ncbi:MAG: VTT domain-containing protein [Idiomarina sp.]
MTSHRKSEYKPEHKPQAEQVKPNATKAQGWLQKLLDSPHALVLIFVLSFMESLVIPIPLELVLIPFMLIERDRIWKIATATLLGCLLGATLGYSLGWFMFDTAGQWALNSFGYQQAYQEFSQQFEQDGFWAIIAVGVTPIPFQVAMLTAGASQYSFALFMLATLLARGIRYFGLALLILWLGDPVLQLWQRHSRKLGVAILVMIAATVGIAQL